MKPLSEIYEPDLFWKNAVLINNITGEIRAYSVADFYVPISELKLNNSVPPDVRQEFDAARHTFVYSFLYYDLCTVAEHYAYAVLEMAFRSRFVADGGSPDDKRALGGLIDTAFSRGWLSREDYEVEIMPGRPVCSLRHFVIRFRNELGHGRMHRFPQGSEMTLRLCCDVINRLFPT